MTCIGQKIHTDLEIMMFYFKPGKKKKLKKKKKRDMAWQKHTQWIVRNIRFSMILGMTVPEGEKKLNFVLCKHHHSVEM